MRRQTTAATTFIGPVTEEKRAGQTLSAQFLILQAGSGIIKLEYPDKQSAKAARDQLLQSNHTHKVPSNVLLQAIHEALSEAKGSKPGETEDGPHSIDH